MRTMHLIESAHTGHATSGIHSFLSVSAHVAIMLAALYATTRPAMERETAPDSRVYFVPERLMTVTPNVPVTRAVTPKPAAPAPVQSKVAAAPSAEPVSIPAVDVSLADPSAAAPAGPVPSGLEGTGAVDAGLTGRSGPYDVGEVEVPAAPLSKSGPDYPERAIRLAISGSATARFIVNAGGRVEKEIVILDSTSPDFTSAVRDFLRRARYRPARVGDLPVRQMVEQRFVFELRR